MNSRDRMMAVLSGERPDRLPNNNIIMGFASTQHGRSYREYVSDYRVLCECDIDVSEKYGIDLISAISDPMREAEGFGAAVELPENGVPYSPKPLVTDVYAAPKVLRTYDPHACRRCEDRLKCVDFLHRACGGEFCIGGWVEGAFAECCDLRGIEGFLADAACEEQEAIHEFLSIACDQAKAFARAQIEAGADVIGIGDAASSLISPRMFREFAHPYQKAIVEAVHAAGGKAKLHICGNITKVIDLAVESGADILDVDWMVDLKLARDAVGDRQTVICGNYDPVAVLLRGTPESVVRAVNECRAPFADRYISAAGCEVPWQTPPENLLAVRTALEQGNDLQ